MQASEIGLLNEKSLHATLKRWYAQPHDRFEVPVDGAVNQRFTSKAVNHVSNHRFDPFTSKFVIDIVRGDTLIEIQTGSFSSVKEKLFNLVGCHPLRLVYPIAREKWLVKLPPERGGQTKRRKSPKRGGFRYASHSTQGFETVFTLRRSRGLFFAELVSFPELLMEQNFTLELLMIQEEEVRRYDGRRGWRRRGWVAEERRLLEVLECRRFECPEDLGELMPSVLPERFTTADLADGMERPRRLGQRMAYCLRKMGVIIQVGKRGRSSLYMCADAAHPLAEDAPAPPLA